ncbi:hypothetical protein Pan216_52250 [Planctomycetes bacterium Pan216]|uniref:Lipoprotein n=1 Tax=Kolteria novifilia TaxID=2527975 RepID=A0A518BBG7_9BACT|nr:hypothetical protein Pan216_52250 [Planctomycetes bacterium Pan216]
MRETTRSFSAALLFLALSGCSDIDPQRYHAVFRVADELEHATPVSLSRLRDTFSDELSQLQTGELSEREQQIVLLLRQARSQWFFADELFQVHHRASSEKKRARALVNARDCLETGHRLVARAKRMVSARGSF